MSGVLFSVAEGVARVSLNEADTHNAFSPSLVRGLHASLDEAVERRDVSAILLRAEGRSFSAGGDLKALAASKSKSFDELLADARPTADLFKRLASMPKPIVAAVDGAALGGGLGLACAATITLASARARFGCTELQVGLFPFLFLPALRRAVGERRALELACLATTIDAQAAADLGIVTRVVCSDVDEEALAVATRLASFSPVALRIGLASARESAGLDDADAIEACLQRRTECYASADAREGATAFLEKRPPRWTGN